MTKVNVKVRGYGGEIVVDKITEEQYKFWNKHEELENYCLNPDRFENLPKEVKFIEDAWHEQDEEGHYWGCSTECKITIEVNGEQFFDGDLTEFADTINEQNDEVQIFIDDHIFIDEGTLEDGFYFMVLSEEKGAFFGGSIEIDEEFDPMKIQFLFATVLGDEFLHDVLYDGDSIDNNDGGNTKGNSFRAEVFSV